LAQQRIIEHNVKLALWDIKSDLLSFEWLSFSRKLNSKTHDLSKDSLSLPIGALGYYKFIEGEEEESMKFSLWKGFYDVQIHNRIIFDMNEFPI